MKHKRHFDLARKLSEKSEYHHKLGAVLIKKGRVIGLGFNKSNKTHPKSKTPYNTIHAEFDAIIGLSLEELKGAEIYVYREYKDGKPALAKPCQHCLQLIIQAGIKKIHYTTNDGIMEEKIY